MDDLGIPNLDAMTPEELQAAEEVCARLQEICRQLRNAKRDRLAGRIVAAQKQENAAEEQYAKLPAWARW